MGGVLGKCHKESEGQGREEKAWEVSSTRCSCLEAGLQTSQEPRAEDEMKREDEGRETYLDMVTV